MVTAVEVVNTAFVSESQAHAIAYAMEIQSKHPIGRAILRYYATLCVAEDLPVIDALQEVAGKGMFGMWDGQSVEMVGDGMVVASLSNDSAASLFTAVRLCVGGKRCCVIIFQIRCILMLRH